MKHVCSLVAALALFSAGCFKYPNTDGPTRYYGASITVDTRAQAEGATQRADKLTADAPRLLSKGKRVAFFPPDSCVTTTASPHGASQEGFIAMQCGVLISSLETAVALDGYEVVSWQALKSAARGGDTLARAKEMGVDVLFEIDQLSVNDRSMGRARATGIDLFQQSNIADRRSLAVSPQVGNACKAVADRVVARVGSEENSATFSTKAVDVKTGRALWYYQKTIRDGDGDQAVRKVDLFFPSRAKTDPAMSTGLNGMQTAGMIFTSLGGVGGGTGTMLLGIGSATDTPELKSIGTGLLIPGLISLGFGLLFIKLGNNAVKDTGPEYPGPDSVICQVAPETPEFMRAATVPTAYAQPAQQSSFNFETSEQGSTDGRRELVERLFKLTSDDFLTELRNLTSAP